MHSAIHGGNAGPYVPSTEVTSLPAIYATDPATPTTVSVTLGSDEQGAGSNSLRGALEQTLISTKVTISQAVINMEAFVIIRGARDVVIEGAAGGTTILNARIILIDCKRVKFRRLRCYGLSHGQLDVFNFSECEDIVLERCTIGFGMDENIGLNGGAPFNGTAGTGTNSGIVFDRCIIGNGLGPGYGLLSYYSRYWCRNCLLINMNTRPRISDASYAVYDGCVFYGYNTNNHSAMTLANLSAGVGGVDSYADVVNCLLRSPIHPTEGHIIDLDEVNVGLIYETGTVYRTLAGLADTPNEPASMANSMVPVTGMQIDSLDYNVALNAANVGCPVHDWYETKVYADIALGASEESYFDSGRGLGGIRFDTITGGVHPWVEAPLFQVSRTGTNPVNSVSVRYATQEDGADFTDDWTLSLDMHNRAGQVLYSIAGVEPTAPIAGGTVTNGGSQPINGVFEPDSVWEWSSLPTYVRLVYSISEGGNTFTQQYILDKTSV